MNESENQILHVSDFKGLINTDFNGNTNAIGWLRKLEGDFAEIVGKVELNENIAQLDEDKLNDLELSRRGQMARAVLLDDLKRLRSHGTDPILNVIRSYDEDDSFPFFPTDVYSFHVDRATAPAATILCTYHGAASDILPNDEATQKVLVPQIRERLRELYDGPEKDFGAFLSEYFFDLHYQAHDDAQPINLGVGNMWRLAIDHPGCPVAPCIHRAPREKTGRKRLLLIC